MNQFVVWADAVVRGILGSLLVLIPMFVPMRARAQADSSGSNGLTLPVSFLDSTGGNGLTIRTIHLGAGEFRFPIGMIENIEPRTSAPTTKQRQLRVLFVGNSMTFYNAMPRMFSVLAAHGTGRRVVVGLVSIPGGRDILLWQATDVAAVIRRMDWDYIVWQLTPHDLVNLTEWIHVRRAINQAIAEPRGKEKTRTKAIFWGQPHVPSAGPGFGARLDTVFAGSAKDAHALLAPITQTWQRVQQADSTVWTRLFYDLSNKEAINDHPSPMGSYLQALVFYRMITGQSPVGLPGDIGPVHISETDKALLQRIAAMP